MSRAIPSPISLVLLAFPIVLPAPAARAEPMWGYRSPTNTSVLSPGSAAGLTFPNTSWIDALGSASVTATPVQSWSAATALNPDRVDGEFYNFGLELKDYASGQVGTLEFGGLLTGDLWKDGTSLTSTFTGPTTQSLELGLHRYTVELDAFEPPTGFGEAGAGRVTADVTVAPRGGDDRAPGRGRPAGVRRPDAGARHVRARGRRAVRGRGRPGAETARLISPTSGRPSRPDSGSGRSTAAACASRGTNCRNAVDPNVFLYSLDVNAPARDAMLLTACKPG